MGVNVNSKSFCAASEAINREDLHFRYFKMKLQALAAGFIFSLFPLL